MPVASSDPSRWQQLHYGGVRLKAEAVLLARHCFGLQGFEDLTMHQAMQRSYGVAEAAAPSVLEQRYQNAGADAAALRQLCVDEPHYPDPLLCLGLSQVLPTAATTAERQMRFRRLGQLVQQRFAGRPDLLLALVAAEQANAVLKSLPDRRYRAQDFYRNTQPALIHLQELWTKGRYEQLLQTYCNFQLQLRNFAASDFVLRAYTIIGAIDRTDLLFRAIYRRHTAELQPVTLSKSHLTPALSLSVLLLLIVW